MSGNSGQYGGTSRGQVEIPGQRNLFFKPESPERLFGRLRAVEDSRFSDSAGKPNRQLVIAGGIVLVGPHFVDGYYFDRKIIPVTANLRDRLQESDAGKLVMIEFIGVKQGTKQFGVEVGVAEIELQKIIRKSILAPVIPSADRVSSTGERVPDSAMEEIPVDEYDDLPF